MTLGADVVTTHKFVSGKADGADPTLVQPSKWNQDHNFSGGSDGNVLVRDSSQPDGASWVPASGIASSPTFNIVRDFGAVADYHRIADAAMLSGSAVLTSASNPFAASDVGKKIGVVGAGAAGTTLFTTIVTFTSAGQVTLNNANASGGNISAKAAEWGTDNTAAVQAAINAAKVAGGTVIIPLGVFMVGSLNLTGSTVGIDIVGTGVNASRLMPLEQAWNATTGHVLDLTGSAFVRLIDFQLGAFNQIPTPATGIFCAQIASAVANALHFDSIYVSGFYTSAALYVYKVPSCDAINSDFYNYTAGAGAHTPIKLTDTNADSLTSSFATVAAGAQVTADWVFTACEFHKFAGAGANNRVIYLDSAKDIRFIGGNVSGGALNYIDTAGQVDRIVFIGTSFETEGEPVTPTNLIGIAATGASDIHFQDCLALCTNFFGGAGAYDGKGAIKGVHFGHVSAGGTLAAASTNYLGPVGTEANEANAHTIVPYDGVLSALIANAGGSPGVGKNFTITVMVNGGAAALTCAINGGGVSASDLTHYVNVSRGDTVSFRWVVDAGANVVGGQVAQCGLQPRPQTAF